MGAQLTLWFITGIAAIIGLLISNLDSASLLIEFAYIKAALILLIVSLFFGLVARSYAIAAEGSVRTANRLYEVFTSPEGSKMMEDLVREGLDLSTLSKDLSEPFYGPMKSQFQKAGDAGAQDFLISEKRGVKWFCHFIYAAVFQGIFAFSGLISLIIGMK